MQESGQNHNPMEQVNVPCFTCIARFLPDWGRKRVEYASDDDPFSLRAVFFVYSHSSCKFSKIIFLYSGFSLEAYIVCLTVFRIITGGAQINYF